MTDPKGGDDDAGKPRVPTDAPGAGSPVDELFVVDRSVPAPAIDDRPSLAELSRWEAKRASLFSEPPGGLPPPPPPVPIDTVPPPVSTLGSEQKLVEGAKPAPAATVPEEAERLSDDLDIDDLERASAEGGAERASPAVAGPRAAPAERTSPAAPSRVAAPASSASSQRSKARIALTLGAVALGALAWVLVPRSDSVEPIGAERATFESQPAPQAEPTQGPQPAPQPAPQAEATPEPQPQPSPQPVTAPVAAAAAAAATATDTATPTAPEARPSSRGPARPEPTVKPKSKPIPARDPASAPTPDPASVAADGVPAEDAGKVVLEARKLLDDDDAEGAEALMRGLLARDPGHMLGRELLTKALIDQDRGPEAVAQAKQIVKRRPTHVPYWLLLGDAQLLAGDDAAARDAWRKALELRPEDIGAKQRLGM